MGFNPQISGGFTVDLLVDLLDIQVGDSHFLLQARDLTLYESKRVLQTNLVIVWINHRVVLRVLRDALQRLVYLHASIGLFAEHLTV